MTRKLRKYPEELKRELVALYEAGEGTVSELEREYDIGESNLRRWVLKYGTGVKPGATEPGKMTEDQARIRELQGEVVRLRQERDILKKALAIFAQPKRNDSSS
jgi:transposase